jgi:hypothetical protein
MAKRNVSGNADTIEPGMRGEPDGFLVHGNAPHARREPEIIRA